MPDTQDAHSHLAQAIITGDEAAGIAMSRELLSAGEPATDIVATMAAAMTQLGARFQRNEVFLPDIIVAADAFEQVMALVDPHLRAQGAVSASRGRVALGVVAGDIHDIGKSIVKIMLEAAGFAVLDLGNDVPATRFVEAAGDADILGISALMSTTMPVMEEVVTLLEQARLRESTKVLVGGAPVSADFARAIGADGYGADAVEGVKLARSWMGEGAQ